MRSARPEYMFALPHLRDEPVVDLVLRRVVEVVRDERELRRRRAVKAVRRPPLGEPQHDPVDRGVDPTLFERLEHRRRRRSRPGDEQEVRLLLLQLLHERGEVRSGERYEHAVDALAAEVAHHALDREVVALTEDRVLREDDDLVAGAVPSYEARRPHVLVGLPSRAEGVLVDAGHGVACGGPEMKRTLFCWARRHLNGDARRGRSGEVLVPLADQILRCGHGLRRVTGVVRERQFDRVVADLVRALRRVVEPGGAPRCTARRSPRARRCGSRRCRS